MLNIPLFTGLAYIPGGDCQMSSINSIKVSTFWRFYQPQINLFVLPIPPAASNLSFLVLNTQLHGNFLKKSRGEGPHPQNLRFFFCEKVKGEKILADCFCFSMFRSGKWRSSFLKKRHILNFNEIWSKRKSFIPGLKHELQFFQHANLVSQGWSNKKTWEESSV